MQANDMSYVIINNPRIIWPIAYLERGVTNFRILVDYPSLPKLTYKKLSMYNSAFYQNKYPYE